MFVELLKKRRSIRSFSDDPVSENEIDALVKAALLSPTSRNIRPWEFIVITDRHTLARLARAKHGAEFLAGATVAIAVLADTRKSDVWVEDCAIAASNILLAAADMGLGACWAQIRNRTHPGGGTAEDYLREVLELPRHLAVEAVVGAGRPAETRPPLTDEDLERAKVRYIS